jgi:hypothetical protein
MFDDKEAWEVKPTEDKTWDAAKAHFVTLYKSKEKFNGEHLTCTEGYESAHSIVSNPFFPGVPSTVLSSTGTMSPLDVHNMMEYTHSLEAALDTTQEHAAFLTTAQNQLLQKLERQQQELLMQTTKFMTPQHQDSYTCTTHHQHETTAPGPYHTHQTKPPFLSPLQLMKQRCRPSRG